MAMMELDQRGTRRRPILDALQQAAQTPAQPVNVSYNGPSPVTPGGAPNQDYTGNTGINGGAPPATPKPPAAPYVEDRPPVVPPPSGAGGGGTAVPKPPPTATPPGFNPYASALDTLYQQYFYRPPTAEEVATHSANLSQNRGTLTDIQRELQREAARLGLQASTAQPTSPFGRTADNNPGLDPAKWTAGHVSPKYAWHEIGLQHDLRTQAGRDAALAQAKQQYPQWFGSASWSGDDFLNLGSNGEGDWNGVTGFDAVFDASGETGSTRPWMGNETFAPGYGPSAAGGTGVPGGPAGAGGVDYAGGSKYFNERTGQYEYRPSSVKSGADGFSGVPGYDAQGRPFPFGLGAGAGDQYTDPYTNMLERFSKMRIEDLLAPVNDESRNSLMGLIQQRFGQLATPGSGANPAAGDLDALLKSVIGESTGQPYTATEEAQLKSNAMNQIEQQRAADRKRALDDAARRGFDPSSGVTQRRLQEIDEHYGRLRTQVDTEFATKAIDERRGRLGEAINYATGRRDVQERELDRGDSRMREALALAAQLSDLSGQVRGERDGRVDKAGSLISLLLELDDRAFNRSLSAQGMAPSMTNIFQNMLGLSNAQGAAQQAGRANSANSTAGMMEMLGYLFGGG